MLERFEQICQNAKKELCGKKEKEQEKDYVICDYDIELTSKELYNDILEILDKVGDIKC